MRPFTKEHPMGWKRTRNGRIQWIPTSNGVSLDRPGLSLVFFWVGSVVARLFWVWFFVFFKLALEKFETPTLNGP